MRLFLMQVATLTKHAAKLDTENGCKQAMARVFRRIFQETQRWKGVLFHAVLVAQEANLLPWFCPQNCELCRAWKTCRIISEASFAQRAQASGSTMSRLPMEPFTAAFLHQTHKT
jgi:hypothetical protein